MYTDKQLIDLAKKQLEFSYAPYSKFHVGAVLLTESGKVYLGCNIENASYGACNCAERTAVFKAVSEGEKGFLKIAIVSSAGGLTYPCGICRQVLAEFAPEIEVILEDTDESIKSFRLDELLPYTFRL